MSDFITAFRNSRWSSTKFWLTVGTFAVFTWLVIRGTLSQDNYLLLAGGELGAYLSVNLLQHKTYTNAETTRVESAAVTRRALNASDAATEQQEDRIQGEARNGVPR